MLDFSVTFIITIINIVILFFILRAILFKPVTKFIDERAKKVQDTRDQAEKERIQAKALRKQYEAQMKKAEEDGVEIIRVARETAKEEAARIVAEGKANVENYLEKARRQLEAEQQTAMALFSTEAAALVLSAASRLLRRNLSDEDSREQAAILLRELGKRHVPS
ncbi:MAG: ATP synthase F0 subunit B [Spirochaetaceae bacterium]|jgi:F-type H+-transporting ATPase subunit b|nr:ATP synthase F0 subunit B [Spirochaetaceae bacterium]